MRKVLITGATSGFGHLMAKAFLDNGDLVIATGRNLTQRRELFATERNTYPNHFFEVDLDVTRPEQVKIAAQEVTKIVGGVDILINNAGFGLFGALEDLGPDEIRHQMEVNFFGTVEVIQSFLPMLRSSQGKIFNFSSVFGFMGFPLTSLYCASKFAVEGLTESLRTELSPHGVQICLIEPGGYRTGFSTNLSWSMKDPHSPYATQVKNYQSLHAMASEKKTQEALEVAMGVLKLSKRKRLPMRKVFGVDGKFSYFLKTFIPEAIYFPLMDFAFKKMLLKKIDPNKT